MGTDDRDHARESDPSASAAVLVEAGASRAREMYRRFLESEYPDALAMAEEVLRERPDDVMALAIAMECQNAIAQSMSTATVPAPAPSGPEPRDSEMPTSIADSSHAAHLSELTPPYSIATLGEPSRQMCQRFLDSDHPAALALAETLLVENPHDRMARAIAEQCRAALEQKRAEGDDDTRIDRGPLAPPTPRD